MKLRKYAVSCLRGASLAVTLSVTSGVPLWAAPVTTATPPSMPHVQSAYGHLSLSFEANHGQWDSQVQFVTRGSRHQLFLKPSDAVLALRTNAAKGEAYESDLPQRQPSNSPSATSQTAVRMRFDGANPQAEMVGLEKLPGIVNYIIGEDPSKWRTNIPTYQKVEYKDVYPGVDLVYYGNEGQLEYDLIVAPGADPTQIALAFEGVEAINIDERGDLTLTVQRSSADSVRGEAATLRMHKPVVYQQDAHGHKHLLAGSYVLLASEPSSHRPASTALHLSDATHVAFQVASYDTSQPLIIDPVLSWGTYLGGSGQDESYSIAVDTAGNAYVTGRTDALGSGFPGTASSLLQSTFAGSIDAFVTKVNAAGTAIIYSTYLGGSAGEIGSGITVDKDGQAYVTGRACGPGFPVTVGSLQSTFAGGGCDVFVTKLNAAGTALVYSTYLGGSGYEHGLGIAVDQDGQTYVTGMTGWPGIAFRNPGIFPGTPGSLIQSTYGGDESDAFVAKLNATGTAVVYATYLGSSGADWGNGIAVDQAGQAYVTGHTSAPAGSGFPGTSGSLIQSAFGGIGDAFVTKINAAGTALIYSTYLGGSGIEQGYAIAVDTTGNAYVTGYTGTTGSGFPGTAGSLIQSTSGGSYDGFVTKLNAAGTALIYSTYLGGSGSDESFGIAVDTAGNAYVTGLAQSGFPGTTDSPIQSTVRVAGPDAFVAKVNATGTALVYATYLGDNGPDVGRGIAVDQAGNAYISGNTSEPISGFPGTAGSHIQNTFAGGSADVFVAKITTNNSPACSTAQVTPTTLWSPNHEFVPVVVTGATDPDGDAVTITVTGITQDEPVNAKGDGNTSPDAMIQAGAASVRAERSGKGNGRVYQLSFRAEDGKGDFCTGTVKVSVPHSMGKGLTAIDDGQAYDSTVQ